MNENEKKEIAKYAVLYLKNRMMIKQRLISMGENQMDFETFMNLYDKYSKILEYADEHPDEVIDGDDKKIYLLEKVVQLRNDFVRFNADFIVMSENQIDELMGYIKESVEKYGLTYKDFYNETFFMREVLNQLVVKMREINDKSTGEKLQRVETFLSFTRASENIGFCSTIEGHISCSEDYFSIITHNLKLVCKINKQGINEIASNELDDEDLLIADKMYIGSLTSNENTLCIFLEKIINGQRKIKAISYNQKIYDIDGEKSQTDNFITFDRAILYDRINDFFEKNDLSFLASSIYTKDSFRETIDAFNKFNNMLPNERNELENIVEIATSWWVNKISSQSFDRGIEGNIGENLALLGEMIVNNMPIAKEKEIQRFKEVLGNKVRILLVSRYELYLKTEYRPEGELALAIKESKLKATFPIKTCMRISKARIDVQQGYSSPFEVIYSENTNTNLKK